MNSPEMKVAVPNAATNSSIGVSVSTFFPLLRQKAVAASENDRIIVFSNVLFPAGALATSTFVPG